MGQKHVKLRCFCTKCGPRIIFQRRVFDAPSTIIIHSLRHKTAHKTYKTYKNSILQKISTRCNRSFEFGEFEGHSFYLAFVRFDVALPEGHSLVI